MTKPPVNDFVDHLFRRESGRMVAILTGIFGAQNLELAEEVVQESLIEALRRWPVGGVPDNPAAWLIKVARNRALDRLRRRTNFDRKAGEVISLMEARLQRLPEAAFSGEIVDAQLRLIFTCCHPDLSPQARIALTLKTVCGFSVREIADAFLAKESTVAQRLTRAKQRIAERRLPYSVPAPNELAPRLDSVHKVLYLLFNEGYSPHDGDAAVRADICEEAVRLARLLAGHEVTGTPESHALAALLLFQGARLATRQDDEGDLLLLEDQDRSLWNRGWIDEGFRELRQAMGSERLTTYHVEAGIAACHAAAETWEDTDWSAILRYYDQLLQLTASPIHRLNYAVALAMVDGVDRALAEIDGLESDRQMRNYFLLPAIRGELQRRAGRTDEAEKSLEQALEIARPAPVRRLLHRRLEEVRGDLAESSTHSARVQ